MALTPGTTYHLSGAGVQALAGGLGALLVTVTTFPPTFGQGRANPANYYDVGLLRIGDANGWYEARAIEASPQVIALPADVTRVGYSLFAGARVDVEELVGTSPYAGPTGPPGSSGSALLASTVLGASAANIDLTGIAGTYTALQLHLAARGDASGSGWGDLLLRFNGDTGGNYDREWTSSLGSVGSGSNLGQTSLAVGVFQQTSSAANAFAGTVIDIPFYAATNQRKNAICKGGAVAADGSQPLGLNVYGQWRSTAAITRITIIPSSGNLVSGSKAALYGVG